MTACDRHDGVLINTLPQASNAAMLEATSIRGINPGYRSGYRLRIVSSTNFLMSRIATDFARSDQTNWTYLMNPMNLTDWMSYRRSLSASP